MVKKSFEAVRNIFWYDIFNLLKDFDDFSFEEFIWDNFKIHLLVFVIEFAITSNAWELFLTNVSELLVSMILFSISSDWVIPTFLLKSLWIWIQFLSEHTLVSSFLILSVEARNSQQMIPLALSTAFSWNSWSFLFLL